MAIFYILIFVMGLCLGSFLNVVIYRLPEKGLSIARPRRSFCPECQNGIAWYDNLPLCSYFILKGRCRHCGIHISWRYPLVEFLCGLLVLSVFLKTGISLRAVAEIYFVLALVAISYIDLDRMIIPARLTLPGMIIGLAVAVIVPDPMLLAGPWLGFNVVSLSLKTSWGLAAVWGFMGLASVMVFHFLASECYFIAGGLEDADENDETAGDGSSTTPLYLRAWVWGVAVLFLVLAAVMGWILFPGWHSEILKTLQSWLVRDYWPLSLLGSLLGFLLGWWLVGGIISAYALLTGGKQGMGGGDMVLLAMIGAFLGWRSIFLTVFGGSFIALGTYLVLALKERSFDFKARLPFGPFLSLAALIHMFFGDTILKWYLG